MKVGVRGGQPCGWFHRLAVPSILAHVAPNWGRNSYPSMPGFVSDLLGSLYDGRHLRRGGQGCGELKIHRVVAAADCGTVNQPRHRAQPEGWVTQTNYHQYPVLRMFQCPAIEVHLIESDQTPSGIGEPGVPPVMGAMANALSEAIAPAGGFTPPITGPDAYFRATGQRIRKLPLFPAV